jgi:hypothetical protein
MEHKETGPNTTKAQKLVGIRSQIINLARVRQRRGGDPGSECECELWCNFEPSIWTGPVDPHVRSFLPWDGCGERRGEILAAPVLGDRGKNGWFQSVLDWWWSHPCRGHRNFDALLVLVLSAIHEAVRGRALQFGLQLAGQQMIDACRFFQQHLLPSLNICLSHFSRNNFD